MAKNDTKTFSADLLDQLLAGRDPKSVLDSGGLMGELKKALAGTGNSVSALARAGRMGTAKVRIAEALSRTSPALLAKMSPGSSARRSGEGATRPS